MLRPTQLDEIPGLLEITAATGFFKPYEVDTLAGVLADYFAEAHDDYGHIAQTWIEAGEPVGFVYYAPTEMTDRTWELWWIVVAPAYQGRGLGRQMLQAVEVDVRAQQGRLLLIETSSTPHYEPTRQFYRKSGYPQVAQIPDFYADGDDKVLFARRL